MTTFINIVMYVIYRAQISNLQEKRSNNKYILIQKLNEDNLIQTFLLYIFFSTLNLMISK